MNVLNRVEAPEAYKIEQVKLLKPELLTLANGIPVYYINGGTEDVLRIEFQFDAGNATSHKALLANACNNLLTSGTPGRTSAQIAEEVDYYGAFFHNETGFDKASVSLYTLNKYLPQTLDIVRDALTATLFPEREVRTFATNTAQRLQINMQKNDFVARRTFNKAVFGENHVYGLTASPEDCEALSREELLAFYKKHYDFSTCVIIVSGRVGDAELKEIASQFADIRFETHEKPAGTPSPAYLPSVQYVEKPDALQSAIRIGRVLVNKTHPDYIDLQILNTILGGYFGSRLMANIREDKGYTYGIGSGLASLQSAGFFYIATEVGTDVTADAVKEIYKELERLRRELVFGEELELVRNYLMGTFLGSIENVFSYAEKFKSIFNYGLGYDYYDRYFESLKNMDALRLQKLAEQYLDASTLTEVIVGKK